MSVLRLTVNLAPETIGALVASAERRGCTKTEALRRSVSVGAFVDDANRRGAQVLIMQPDGSTVEMVQP